MTWLMIASIIWGLSFGLIKGLTTEIDPFVLGVIRSCIAAGFFLPWYLKDRGRPRVDPKNDIKNASRAAICGFTQIGLMYGPYLLSFKYLKAHEVALWTMTTPLVMACIIQIKMKSISWRVIISTIIATAGGMIVAWKDLTSTGLQTGIILVQLSNVFFATGLLLWKKWFSEAPVRNGSIMFPYFGGAALAAAILALCFSRDIRPYTTQEWLVMAWLGLVASGMGFFIWNQGALRVSETSLAVANNLKLPIAIMISLTIFAESADPIQLLSGLAVIMLALRIASGSQQTRSLR